MHKIPNFLCKYYLVVISLWRTLAFFSIWKNNLFNYLYKTSYMKKKLCYKFILKSYLVFGYILEETFLKYI